MTSRLRVPHTLVLLYAMIVFAYALTWLLPAGEFATAPNEQGREVVVPGTYAVLAEAEPPPLHALLTVIPRGLEAAQGIIFFVFLIGGALAVVRATGALDAALGRALLRFSHRPLLLVAGGVTAFALGSSTIGMAAEYIPLTAILVSLCVGLRMDTMTAVGIILVGYGIGYGTAAINPFTVLVAQEVAGLQPLSGWPLRIALFAPFVALGTWHVWRYAKMVREDPAASLVADVPEAQASAPPEHPEVRGHHRAILALLGATLVLLIWGITQHGWYLVELGAVFLALALLSGLLARMSLSDIARHFTAGAAELTGTALLIGFARSIELILSDGQVLHTIVNGLATPLAQIGSAGAAIGMLGIQSLLNFFVPSGSGQAYVTMPLMAPIGDLVGVSRQVAVLAYQMGDGFMNILVPTNAVLMGILGVCGVPYDRWLRFIGPLMLQLMAAASLTLVLAVLLGYR